MYLNRMIYKWIFNNKHTITTIGIESDIVEYVNSSQ